LGLCFEFLEDFGSVTRHLAWKLKDAPYAFPFYADCVRFPWSCLRELGEQVRKLKRGQWLITHLAWSVNDAGGLGRTFWQQEAGDVQPGSYGFSPHWGGGRREYGGLIITDWGFAR